MEFKKYNSIENSYNTEFLEKIKEENLELLEYVVQEKVHGANCCFVTDGKIVNLAKRTGFIETDEKFYNYEELLDRYTDKVVGMFHQLKKVYPETENILIYGEMFGGRYPHPDVKNDPKIMCIQKGVFYCPKHEFYAFDLYIKGNEGGRYLSVNEANIFFESADFLYAKTLFQGTLEECLKYPNDFQSLIAQWLGLPAIEDNICEGIVIKPEKPVYLRNGSRLLLKSKNSKFAEKKSVKKRQPTAEEPLYSKELTDLLPVTEEYVTENRLNNVVSKIGELSLPADLGKLIGLFSKDIQEDFMKEHSAKYVMLEKSEQKILNKHINKQASDIIKQVYIK